MNASSSPSPSSPIPTGGKQKQKQKLQQNPTWNPNPDENNKHLAQVQQPRLSQPENAAPRVADAASPVPHKPALEGESPSMKKRTSPHELSAQANANANGDSDVPAKRAKEARPAVKLLPAKYELCEVGDIVVLIANMISELIATNDELPLRNGVLTRFHSRTPPGISVLDYLNRLAKHATLTPPLLLSMVYYIDRLCSLYPAFTINTLTVHRFLITAATVAAKGLSDSFWNNRTYARVGGIRMTELGMLELEFLYRVDWKIVPNPEVLVDYYHGLVERSPLYELQGNNISKESNANQGQDSEEGLTSPETAATDEQWQAWMDDVSREKAAHEGGSQGGGSKEESPKDETGDKEMA
jgi:hypothetical protein